MARVLIVDDESFVRQLLRTYLERAGHIVLEAPNGKEALDLFAAQRPDLVVTDNTMPELTGADMIRELRRDAPGTKIIAMSGFPSGDGLLEVNCLLFKLFIREEFLFVVEQALSRES